MNAVKVFVAIFMCAPFVLAGDNICLSNESEYDPSDELLPHESDCRLFYKCDHGKPVLFKCPSGLEFNPTTKECDWPESAGCSKALDAVKPCIPPEVPKCPPHVINRPAVYLPHETDCRKFYQCDWEVAYVHDCPEGLHFSVFNKVCDWPERAQCAC